MKWLYAMAALGILLTGQAFAQEAPEPEATVEAPAPVPTLIFKTSATIPAPRVIEVDGSVSCRLDGDVLRCTARVVEGPVE